MDSVDKMSVQLDRINTEIFGDDSYKIQRERRLRVGKGISQKLDEMSQTVETLNQAVVEMSQKNGKIDFLYDLIVGKGRAGKKYYEKNSGSNDYSGMAEQVDEIQKAVIAIMFKLAKDR